MEWALSIRLRTAHVRMIDYDKQIIIIRACTGFDGDVKVWEAIRRLRNCVKSWNLNIKADDKLALAA